MRICMYEGGALKYLEWAGKQIPLKLHGGHSNRCLVFLFLDGVHKLSFPKNIDVTVGRT